VAAPAPLTFARIDDESSVFRWYMSRHGDTVLANWPGLLARLTQGPAAVAVIFQADRAVGMLAWRAGTGGVAELLAEHGIGGRHTDPGRIVAFVYGPDGPLRAAQVNEIWTLADTKAQVKRLKQAGYSLTKPILGLFGRRDGPLRLERQVAAPMSHGDVLGGSQQE
jgi:hypothetical protein